MKRFLQCCVYSLDFMVMFREKSDNERLRKIFSILLIPIGVFRYFYLSVNNLFKRKQFYDKEKCAVVVIVKNEGRYMREYFDFYSGMGCDIIVYDNESVDELKEIVKRYRNVIYHWWPGRKRQIDAYNHAINTYRTVYKYMMFFDADEFLVCDEFFQDRTLLEILDDYFRKNKRAAGIGVNWLLFGSSGSVEYPAGGVLDSFRYCARDEFERNRLVKSLVIPEKIIGWVDSHLPTAIMGYYMANADGEKIKLPRIELSEDKGIRLYHYYVKNKKHFVEKVNKGFADRIAHEDMDMFEYCDRNDIYNEKAMKLKAYLSGKSQNIV